jgi:putative acetyltransferase
VSATDGLPDGVTIREQAADDAPEVYELVGSAFGRGEVSDLDAALARRGRGTAYVASTAHGLVGHLRLTWGWLDAPDRLVEILVLSPLSVLPAWQRRGVGRALVARAIRGAAEMGAPLLVLEGDPAYYSTSGFVPAAELGVTRPSVRIPEPAFQLVALPGHESWMRGPVVYPDTFWEYDCVGLRGERLTRALGRSPKILRVSWGEMEVEGLGVGKDFALYPGGGHTWDWSETGMGHEPGIRPVDIAELLDRGARVVVLSQGMERRLQVDPSTLDHLAARGVEVHVAETGAAVDVYNQLVDHGVGGLFHSTC